jgi:hypothetical protein
MANEATRVFDAPAHMRKIRTRQGMQDYLDVKWRVAWLRAEHPEAEVITEQISGDEQHARFKCTIRFPSRALGDGTFTYAVGTGHGSETLQDFPDFYEKAETKSIGRACAVLGYGTDAAADFDDGEPLDGRAAAKDERRARQDERTDTSGDTPSNTPPATNGAPGGAQAQQRAPEPSRLPATRRPKDGGAVRPAEEEGAAAIKALAQEGPLAAPPAPADASNVHQHAQLRALAEHGYGLDAALEGQGVDTVEALSREQAKELIIAGRASTRGHMGSAP